MTDDCYGHGETLQNDFEENDNEDGVDRTLIRWMLSLTLGERLQVLQDSVNYLEMLRHETTFR